MCFILLFKALRRAERIFMFQSHHFSKRLRALLACILSLVTLASLCLSAAAANAEHPFDQLFSLDPNNMTGLLDNDGNENFSLKHINGTVEFRKDQTVSDYTGNVVTISRGTYQIWDDNNTLGTYKAVSISADFCFSAFPSGKNSSETESSNPSEPSFCSQSVLSWSDGSTYYGLRIDSNGGLYYGDTAPLNFTLDLNTWYNIEIVYSEHDKMMEFWVDGARIGSAGCKFYTTSKFVRFFDVKYQYTAHVKNINISASNDPYYCNVDITKEASADFISYQTTMPDNNGNFKIRVLAGINSLEYQEFGYKVLVLTKDQNGKAIVSREPEGTSNKAYSSIYGGDKLYTIKEEFGYEYACLATIENLNKNVFTELVIFPYTTSADGNKIYGSAISLIYTGTGDTYADGYPRLCVDSSQSIYGHSTNTTKTANEGYEPLSYAEKITDEWFNTLYPEIYKEEHTDLGSLNPTGYGTTYKRGDFTEELPWNNRQIWSTDGTYQNPTTQWQNQKFARTLSTLGTTVANKFVLSNASQYDSYGGIIGTNIGCSCEKTGYFHAEKINGRFYIIDPLGNPYFAMGVNAIKDGDTANQINYSREQYGDAFFTEISASLKETGINTAFESDYNALLSVENGLATVVSLSGVNDYMVSIGRAKVSEGQYPHNNTINVFDPDFGTYVHEKNVATIKNNGYATMPNLFGYTADNELPEGADILERYLTLDPDVPANSFSYHVAWTWLAKKLETSNPTLAEYMGHKDKVKINDEFQAFLYATIYKTIGESIDAADPNHMYFGSRVHGDCITSEGYNRAAGYYLDILTINLYGGLNPDLTTINNIYKYSGKPFIVTEFFAKALDSIDANGYKLANSGGAGILVETQQDRADYYEHYVLTLLEAKSCVGWTWYRFRDNDQGLWETTDGKYKDLCMLCVNYTQKTPYSFIDAAGNIYKTKDLCNGNDPSQWRNYIKESDYKGEPMASNQNINKGIYNNDYSSTVTVYTYNSNGKLASGKDASFGSMSYEVTNATTEKPIDGTVLNGANGKQYTIGRVNNSDGTYTITELTTYEGKYLALADSIKNISDNIMAIITYFDAN